MIAQRAIESCHLPMTTRFNTPKQTKSIRPNPVANKAVMNIGPDKLFKKKILAPKENKSIDQSDSDVPNNAINFKTKKLLSNNIS